MNVTVTGMSGLLGQHVSQQLTARGARALQLRARFDSSTEGGIVPIETTALATWLKSAAPDFLLHLAGTSRAPTNAEFCRINTLYAAVLLDAMSAAELHQTTLVLVGSSAEYGPMSEDCLPATEDAEAHPADMYGASKLAQTILGLTAARNGQRVIIVRPSNMIGPGMSRELAIGSFVQQLGAIARGEREAKLEVGDLSASRDFIDVGDAADCIIRLAETPAAAGQVVNVCSGRALPVNDILQTLLGLFERYGHGSVRVEHRAIAATARSSRIHFSSNRRLLGLLGTVEYTPIEVTLSRILRAELDMGQRQSNCCQTPPSFP